MEENDHKLVSSPGKEKTIHNGIEYTLFCTRDDRDVARLMSNELKKLGLKTFVETIKNTRHNTYKVWWVL